VRGKRGFDVFCEGGTIFGFSLLFCLVFFFCIIGVFFSFFSFSFLSVIWVVPSIVE